MGVFPNRPKEEGGDPASNLNPTICVGVANLKGTVGLHDADLDAALAELTDCGMLEDTPRGYLVTPVAYPALLAIWEEQTGPIDA